MIPKVIIYNAISLDGRIDGFPVDLGQYYGIAAATWKEDATLVGSETMLAGMGQLGKESEEELAEWKVDPQDGRPLVVVPDSRGRLRIWSAIRSQPYWKDVVVLCSLSTPSDYLDYLKRQKVRYIVAGEDKVDMRAALERLTEDFGVRTVRVDSGGTLNGVLLRQGLASEVNVLIHPCLVGGTSPGSMFRPPDASSMEAVVDLKLQHSRRLKGGVIWLRYEVLPRSAQERKS